MSRLTVSFETDNAAFTDGNGPEEAARILRKVAGMVADGYTSGPLHDLNGNAVGTWDAEFPEGET